MSRVFPALFGLALLLALPAARVEGRAPTEHERELFRQGGAAYEAGRYGEAVDAYVQILRSGLESRDVYYNLGNACLKEGRLGPAVLNYRRALRIDPTDDDARNNLTYARRRTQDATPQELADPFPWLTAIRPGSHRAGVLFLLAFNLAAVFFAGRHLLRRPPSFLGPLFGVAAALTVLTGTVLFLEARAETTRPEAVVMEPAVDVRSGPGQEYTVAFVVHEGTEVSLGRRSAGWSEISVTTDLKGWVPSASVEAVE